MAILSIHDAVGGRQVLAEGAEPVVSYVPSKRQIKLAVSEGGRELLIHLDIETAKAMINDMMECVHHHKVATKRREPAKPLLRKRANRPRPIATAVDPSASERRMDVRL